MYFYEVKLKSTNCNLYFIAYLNYYNISFDYLVCGISHFVVNATPCQIHFISCLCYVESINPVLPTEEDDYRSDSISDVLPDAAIVRRRSIRTNLNFDLPSHLQRLVNWGYYNIKADRLQDKGITGKGINVAILDSGAYEHPYLKFKERLSFVSSDPSPDDILSHGTSVAGVIGTLPGNPVGIKGVAYDCNLYSLKILDRSDQEDLEGIINAISWCMDNNIQVVNMSFGFSEELIDQMPRNYIQRLQRIINLATNRGIIFVAAAGNSNDPSVYIPALLNNVLAIGATDSKNRRWNEGPDNGSCYGAGLDFMAPGVNIISTSTPEEGYYTIATGTSLSAPFVTGLIALLLSEDPTRTPDDIFKILKSNAKRIPNWCFPNYLKYGYGIVRAPK